MSIPKIGLPVTIASLSGPVMRWPMILKSFGVLEFDGPEIRRRHRERLVGELAVADRSLGRGVEHFAGRRRELGFGHVPRRRGGRDQHLPRGRADLAHRRVVAGHRGAAAGRLRAVLRIEIALLDLDGLPVDVELFSDQHRQRRLDALADFRILADDGDRAVTRDLDERVRHERRRWRAAALSEQGAHGLDVGGDDEAAAGERADSEERAAIENGGAHKVSLPLPAAALLAARRTPSRIRR